LLETLKAALYSTIWWTIITVTPPQINLGYGRFELGMYCVWHQ